MKLSERPTKDSLVTARSNAPDNTTSAKEKGDALEIAVGSIERAIVDSASDYADSTFRFEWKKHVTVAGVRHEIDIYITAERGSGYDSVFIFECKNWRKPVGKNEITIFAEKINAIGAARGFFVARSYTKDAIAQARQNRRLALLEAVAIDHNLVMIPASFHGIYVDQSRANMNVMFTFPSTDGRVGPIAVARESPIVLGGTMLSVDDFVGEWFERIKDSRTNRFPSTSLDGTHILEFQESRSFGEGEASIDSRPIKSIDIAGTFEVQVIRAVVVSALEVGSRGRVVTVQVEMPVATVRADFVQTYS